MLGMFHPVVVSAALSHLTWKKKIPLISLGYFKLPHRVTLLLMNQKKIGIPLLSADIVLDTVSISGGLMLELHQITAA